MDLFTLSQVSLEIKMIGAMVEVFHHLILIALNVVDSDELHQPFCFDLGHFQRVVIKPRQRHPMSGH